MRKRSPKHRLIDALAGRWADRRYGRCSGVHAMRKSIHQGTLAAYMRNWLLEHGEHPTGRHKVTVHDRKAGAFRFNGGFTFTVDFDRLHFGAPLARRTQTSRP